MFLLHFATGLGLCNQSSLELKAERHFNFVTASERRVKTSGFAENSQTANFLYLLRFGIKATDFN